MKTDVLRANETRITGDSVVNAYKTRAMEVVERHGLSFGYPSMGPQKYTSFEEVPTPFSLMGNDLGEIIDTLGEELMTRFEKKSDFGPHYIGRVSLRNSLSGALYEFDITIWDNSRLEF